MTDAMKRFWEAASGNAELAAKLKAAHGKDRDVSIGKAIAIAREYGHELERSDFEMSREELDDQELQAVAGGECACPVAGIGGGKDEYDGNDYACVCMFYGQGGDGRASDANCFCPGAGFGRDDKQFF